MGVYGIEPAVICIGFGDMQSQELIVLLLPLPLPYMIDIEKHSTTDLGTYNSSRHVCGHKCPTLVLSQLISIFYLLHNLFKTSK